MHRAVRAVYLAALALCVTPALADDVKLLDKYKDWSAYAAAGSPKVCFAVSQPKSSLPKKVNRDPIYFYISQWPADNVTNEVSVKMGYPFAAGAKVTVTIGTAKFELFTKDEGAFVEKPDVESKLVEAMKSASTMKVEGKSARGTATSDTYSLSGIGDALDRAAKECSG
ncbi:MAG: invasion associated locus B family protein [Actinomycetota bacterium]